MLAAGVKNPRGQLRHTRVVLLGWYCPIWQGTHDAAPGVGWGGVRGKGVSVAVVAHGAPGGSATHS
jgi:hypothetical protein